MGVGKVGNFRKDEEEKGGFLYDTPWRQRASRQYPADVTPLDVKEK
jgi:hypothetical protein